MHHVLKIWNLVSYGLCITLPVYLPDSHLTALCSPSVHAQLIALSCFFLLERNWNLFRYCSSYILLHYKPPQNIKPQSIKLSQFCSYQLSWVLLLGVGRLWVCSHPQPCQGPLITVWCISWHGCNSWHVARHPSPSCSCSSQPCCMAS
jgi:hypothetical protein